MTYPPCILIHNPLAFKLAVHEEQIYKCLFGNIKYDATITKIELSSVFFWRTFADFLSRWFIAFHWGPRKISCWSSCSAKTTVRNCSVFKIPLFGATTKVSLSFIGNEFRSVTQSSQTRVLHEVALLVFCGILASFLAWISLSLTVMIPRPESSLSVKTSVVVCIRK